VWGFEKVLGEMEGNQGLLLDGLRQIFRSPRISWETNVRRLLKGRRRGIVFLKTVLRRRSAREEKGYLTIKRIIEIERVVGRGKKKQLERGKTPRRRGRNIQKKSE